MQLTKESKQVRWLSFGLKKTKRTHPRARKVSSAGIMRQIRYLYHRFITLRGTPEYLARGLAAGVFAGSFPIFGLQTLVGVAIAVPLRGHKIMAAAGTWISNPFTYIPIYFFNFQVGQWLLGGHDLEFEKESLLSSEEILKLGVEFAFTLFVGCFAVGLVTAIASYFGCLWFVRRLHSQRKRSRDTIASVEPPSVCSKR